MKGKVMKKKQFNYYLDGEIKYMIEYIRTHDPNEISMLNDSQVVERLIKKRAEVLGYKLQIPGQMSFL